MLQRIVDVTLLIVAAAAVTVGLQTYSQRLLNEKPDETAPHVLVGQSLSTIMTRGEGTGAMPFTPNAAYLDGRLHVLFAFRSNCPYCDEAASTWRELLSLWSGSIRSVGIAAESRVDALRWIEDHELAFDTVIAAASRREIQRRWGVAAVPAVLVLAPDAHVSLVEFGVPSPRQKTRLARHVQR